MDRTDLERIAAFIRRHHVMTLATVGADGRPWCAHAFYAWMPVDEKSAGGFVFMNNPETRHGGEMAANARVAAGIALETRVVGRLQGLQIEGTVRRVDDGGEGEIGGEAGVGRGGDGGGDGEAGCKTGGGGEGVGLEAARRAYLKRFPYATIIEQPLWVLSPDRMKLTDNTLGFGKKLTWER